MLTSVRSRPVGLQWSGLTACGEEILSRKLEEDPERVQAGRQDMLSRYERDPAPCPR